MKTIGLIGGLSWESTVTYYKIINEEIKRRLGGFHSAKIILNSVDFAEIESCQTSGDWERAGEILTSAARSLERAGADFALICANTMHKVAPQIGSGTKIPLLHIADVTASALNRAGIKRAALLGTRYTMGQDFYRTRMSAHGVETMIPDEPDAARVNDVIYNELCLGEIKPDSRAALSEIIARMKLRGAEAVILGCTELGLLLSQEDSPLPVFDTTVIHALAAVDAALA